MDALRQDMRDLAGRVPPSPRPEGILRPDFAWIDVEASSLSVASYPIEVGWSFDDLSGGSILIAPGRDWETWDDWDREAEAVHGIARSTLLRDGLGLKEAANLLNAHLGGRLVFSDTVGEDGEGGADLRWLRRLFAAADTRMAFDLANLSVAPILHLGLVEEADARSALARSEEAAFLAERHHPAIHHAGADAVHMAAAFRMTVDETYARSIRAMPSSGPKQQGA